MAHLLRAARDGKLHQIRREVKCGTDIEVRNGERCTPLMSSSLHGFAACVEFLLAHKADINASTDTGQFLGTSLHMACSKGHFAVAKLLVDGGANIHAYNKAGCTPLHLACISGKLECVELLLEHKANVNAGRSTPLLYVTRQYHNPNVLDILRLLLREAADPLVKSHDDGCSPLHYATRLYSDNQARDGTALLLDYKVDINVTDSKGWTPLHYACSRANPEVYSGETVRLLIARKADIEAYAHGEGNGTPLHVACSTPSWESILDLTYAEANLDRRDDAGMTPLHRYCQVGTDSCTPVWDSMTEHGGRHVDVNVVDNAGRTPLHLATSHYVHVLRHTREQANLKLIRWLLKSGANVRATDSNGRMPEEIPNNYELSESDQAYAHLLSRAHRLWIPALRSLVLADRACLRCAVRCKADAGVRSLAGKVLDIVTVPWAVSDLIFSYATPKDLHIALS
eukprot:NODE_2048_length_1528_cov_92.242705_g1950_i0.p1 GENE.NODE_2048_length_1528_cov_92.242705_g1950_i0~~NODE_2048_length_1528_cov_92.242705_g1950_i0.p1  ORF type:complete len:479 (-),score=29.49 NODE_2048_length_1528_cov_92.242705_g1950_i0:91-1458(-)